MTLRNWLRSWSRPTPPSTRGRSPLGSALEALEDRTVPSGFALALGADTPAGVGQTTLDAGGNLYVSGTFRDSMDFDPGPAVRTLTSAGEDDTFLAKYAPDGSFQWARRIGSSGADVSVGAGYTYPTVVAASGGPIRFSTAFAGTADITGVNSDGTTYARPDTVTVAGTLGAMVGAIDADGTVSWVQAAGGTGALLRPRQMGVTPDGAILLAGSFTGTSDFDPAATYGDGRDVLTSAGDEDIFVVRLSSTGSFDWVKQIGGSGKDAARVTTDAVGNAYLWGASLSPTLTIGSQTFTRRGSCDSYVARMDPTTGAFLWARQIGGAGATVAYQGSTSYHDPAEANPGLGNATYVTGVLTDGDGPVQFGNTTISLSRTTGLDTYIAKVDGNGNFLWARLIGGSNDEMMYFLTADAAGSVYAHITVSGSGVSDFDPGAGQALVAPRPGTTLDGYLLKLDSAGTFEWAREMGRHARPAAAADGTVYIFGSYDAATANFDIGSGSATISSPTGATNFYLLKLDQKALGGAFGRVLYTSGYPAEGAAVVLKQNGLTVASTTTGAAGEFTFRYLAAGSYTIESLGGSRTITLTAPGQFLSDQTVTVATPAEATKFFVVNDGSTDRTYQYGSVGSTNADTALATGNTVPRGAASNAAGTRLWVADANKTVYVYNASGGLLGSWSASGLPNNATVEGIATNGTDIWLLTNGSSSDTVYRFVGAASRLSGSTKATSSFNLSVSDSNPKGVVTDGSSFWVVDDGSTDRVFKYTLAGSLLGSWIIDPGNGSPTGLTINPNDVSDIWVVDNVALKVFQYSGGAARTSGSQRSDRTFTLAPGNTNPQDIADPPPPSSADPSAEAGATTPAIWVGGPVGEQRSRDRQQAATAAERPLTATGIEGDQPDAFSLWFAPAGTIYLPPDSDNAHDRWGVLLD